MPPWGQCPRCGAPHTWTVVQSFERYCVRCDPPDGPWEIHREHKAVDHPSWSEGCDCTKRAGSPSPDAADLARGDKCRQVLREALEERGLLRNGGEPAPPAPPGREQPPDPPDPHLTPGHGEGCDCFDCVRAEPAP